MLFTNMSRVPVRSFIKWSTITTRFCSTTANAEVDSSTKKPIIVLGIETSCDDTGIGIVNSNGQILGEAKHSQGPAHSKHGGILPYVARDMHKDNITKVCEEALRSANLKLRDIDAIATTIKPGLPMSLSVGIEYGKYLCGLSGKPFIPIHHMKAHALTIRMVEKVEFPYLVLLISGGHTLLGIVEDVEQFYLLGSSFDDAAGEAMDKIARRLKLTNIPELAEYSGGAAIEQAALKATEKDKFAFSVPMIRVRDCNFSFSGLKNIIQLVIDQEEKDHNIEGDGIIPSVYNVCASLQVVIAKHLCHRVFRAMQCVQQDPIVKRFPKGINKLVLSGGVASNSFIGNAVSKVCKDNNYEFFKPPPHLCTDNGIMIAWNGVEKYLINSEILTDKEEIEKVDLEHKCILGEDWRDLVVKQDIKCKIPAI